MSKKVKLTDVLPEPSCAVNSLPVATRLQRLPLAELTWENFERLCVRLVSKDSDVEFAQAYGVRGQDQEGIDLYVRKCSNGRYVVWQCKRYQKFDEGDVAKAVRRFIKAFRVKESGIPIKEADALILAVTADLSKTAVAREIERQNKRLRRRFNIALIPRDIQGLSDKLKPHSDIVADFFGPAWVEEFCGIRQSSAIASELAGPEVQTALRSAQEGLSSYGNADLDRIRDLWGERHEDDALRRLETFKNAPTWPLLNAEVRAKALRIEAGLRLQKEDVPAARRLLDEAKKTAPNANARVLEGRLICHDNGADAALMFLGQPTTDDERVFRWDLLLQLGRPKEVTEEFAALHERVMPAGDFSSVVALAQLAQRDVFAADQTIQAALQRKPHHVTSRYVAAVVDYYWGISLAFRAWQHMTWPVPPPRYLVKRDKVSHERRRRAGQTFQELAATVLNTTASELRVWQLACVTLDSKDVNEPSKLAQLWIEEDPTNLPVLVWASAFGLNIDRGKSISALRQRLDGGNGSLEDLLVLLGLFDDVADLKSYEDLITQYRPLFVTSGREHLWFLHRAQLLVEQDKSADALQLVGAMPESDGNKHIIMAVRNLVVERNRRKEDCETLLKVQEEEYRLETTPENLLACCRTNRLLQQWDFIAQHAEELVREVGTQSALEMAAESLLQVRRARECLNLLDTNRGLCQEGDWTVFLRQVAAEAHRLLGDLPTAIQELERAAASEPGVGAKVQLFRTLLEKGDMPGALQIARSLSSNPHVPAEFFVGQVIPIARHHDLELARDLIIQTAAASALSPEVEAKLMDEAYRTGVESVSRKLTVKLTNLAIKGEGPLKAFSYEQTRQMLIDRKKMAGELLTRYARGEIPAHLVSSGLDLPIARLLHETPRLNLGGRPPGQSQAAFTRYASHANASPCSLPLDLRELYLDISSFLLLDALELLPIVETTFGRVHVSSSLIQCLEEHLDQLSPQQPPRAFARQETVKLLDATKITLWKALSTALPADSPLVPFVSDLGVEWCQRLSEIHSESGLLIDFLPLHSRLDVHQTVILPTPFAETVISAPQMIRAMKRAGWLWSPEATGEIQEIENNSPDGRLIHLYEGMTIHLDSGQAEELALAGALAVLSEKSHLTIEAGEAVRLRHEASKERADESLKNEIKRLLMHLSNAIGKAKYQVHSETSFEREGGQPSLRPIERALFEAIHFGSQEKVPVCIDDRAIRRHSTIGKAPLCDTWDLIHHLHDRGAITNEVFQGMRSRMRFANLRYVPLDADEILTCVRSAPIQNSQFVETPELACLRRYVSGTLLDFSTLQGLVRDPQGNMCAREGFWPGGLRAAVTKALADVWLKADPANNHAELQADWILVNLGFDDRLPAELFGAKPPDYCPLGAVARQIALLFGLGVGLYEPANDASTAVTRRKRYFQWLADRMVTPFLANNPDLWSRVGEQLRAIFSFLDVQELGQNNGKNEFDKRVIQHLIAIYIADLPPELKDALNLSSAELKALGLTTSSPGIETLGLTFPARDFWEAIARAVKQKHATLWTPDRQTKLRIRFNGTTNQISISATGATNSQWRGLRVPFLALFSPDQKHRESALRREADALDLDEPRLSEVIQEIAEIQSTSERVAKRMAYRGQSAAALYEDVQQKIRDKKPVSLCGLLPPHVDCLRRYLRLELNDTAPEDFAQRLITRIGWTESVARLSRLPASLPDAILNEWERLSANEQCIRLDELKAKLVSPVERLHFVELLCHPATKGTERLPEVKAHLNWLTDEAAGVAHCGVALAIVRWVHLRLGWHAEASSWPAFTRLCVAWSHGGVLYRAFQTANARSGSVETWFRNNSQELFADRFVLVNGLANDAANPVELRECTLILKGIVAACAKLSDDGIAESGVQQNLLHLFEARSFVDFLDIWEDRSLGGNLLGSYLADGSDEKLKRVVGEAAFDQSFRVQPRPITEQALDALLKDPRDINSMLLLNCVVADRPIYDDLRGKVATVLTALDVVGVLEPSPGVCWQYILLTSQLAVSSTDTNLMDKVWAECCRLAAHLAASDSLNGRASALHEQLALSLTDAALRLSSSPQGRTAGLQAFVARLTELARKWPAFARYHGPALIQALNRVPSDELGCVSELTILLRSHR
jgi:hypothetical protein